MAAITWNEITRVEPALGDLLNEIRAIKDDGASFCANTVWYGPPGHRGLKGRMSRLVGEDARKKELRTSEAYDVAYETLYAALPNCRRCSCVSAEDLVA